MYDFSPILESISRNFLFCLVIPSHLLEFTKLGVSLAHEKPLSLEKKNISKWSGVRTTNIEHQKRTIYPLRHLT